MSLLILFAGEIVPFEVAFRSHMKASSGLTDVGIDWGMRPRSSPVRGISLYLVSGGRDYHMAGRSPLRSPLVQVDCWDATYKGAKDLARTVIAAMDALKAPPLQAFVEGERDFFEASEKPQLTTGTTEIFRTSLDVRVWATEVGDPP